MTNNPKTEIVADQTHIKARPWICCQDPFFIKIVDHAEGERLPLVALCDKQVGHAGRHRGRADGNTLFWRKETTAQGAQRRAANLRHNDRLTRRHEKEKQEAALKDALLGAMAPIRKPPQS